MQRKIIVLLAISCLALAIALAFVLLRGPPRASSFSVDETQGNASQPYRKEMDCIDRLLQQRDLDANDVAPAFSHCRGNPAPGGNLEDATGGAPTR